MAGHSTWRHRVPHHRRRAGGGPNRAEPAARSRLHRADAVQRPVPPRRELLVHRVGDLGDQVGGIDGGDPGVQLLAMPAGEDLGELVTWPARVAMLPARSARLEVPGDHQDVRVAGQDSGQAHLGRRSVQGRGRQHRGVLGHLGYTEERRAEGEVRHPRPGCAPGTSRGGARPSGRGGCRRSGDALVALGEECVRAGAAETISPRAPALTCRPGAHPKSGRRAPGAGQADQPA
jgi:hypothetical protein